MSQFRKKPMHVIKAKPAQKWSFYYASVFQMNMFRYSSHHSRCLHTWMFRKELYVALCYKTLMKHTNVPPCIALIPRPGSAIRFVLEHPIKICWK